MIRALDEFRVAGIITNLRFLQGLINHDKFEDNNYNTKFIDGNKHLIEYPSTRNRAANLLHYLADTIVNGNTAVKNRISSGDHVHPRPPDLKDTTQPADGTRQLLNTLGPKGLADWMLGNNN